jgi:hypothetical protein
VGYFKVLLQHSPGESEGKYTEYSDKLSYSSNLLEYCRDASIRTLMLCHRNEHVLQSSGQDLCFVSGESLVERPAVLAGILKYCSAVGTS